jgi:L-threonylcarbamoyladenylate synthase
MNQSSGSEFERCIEGGGVAVFPSDTVYGLACDPLNGNAVTRLYELKGRPPAKAAAVMFFDIDAALATFPELGELTRLALARLLPGAVTVLVPNPRHRYPLACGEDPGTLGLRVISVPVLAGVRLAVMQSSANLSGGADARRLTDVPESIRAGADLVLDGGELPGVSSTVVDLRRFEEGGIDTVSVLRAGAVGEDELATALAGQFHFNPATYVDEIREDIPEYDDFQAAVVEHVPAGARSILELGTGTGETARRLLERCPQATLVGIDESQPMLAAAAAQLDSRRVRLSAQALQDPLPAGAFELVASALCVHHLTAEEKADLFVRVHAALVPGGRFVLGDVIVPPDPALAASIPLTPGYDKPSTVAEQLVWLARAGFEASVVWESGALAVLVADRPA